MPAADRSLYIEAVQTLKRSGAYDNFVLIHQNAVNDPFAHGTSGFLPWHRKFLLEYENALRCLDAKFACVTIPYWDWGEWQFYCNADPLGCTRYDDMPAKLLRENPNAQSLISAFGGPGVVNASMPQYGNTDHPKGTGCVQKGPFAYWKDFEGNCLTRSIDWSLPGPSIDGVLTNGPLSDTFKLLELMTSMHTYGKVDGYRAAIQGTPHNMPHNYLGGHLRSMRSPTDPIFWSHHAFIDKNWALWQDCVDVDTMTKETLKVSAYEGIHRSDLPDDGLDSAMPFRISNYPSGVFEPSADHCDENAKGGASNACRKCLGQLSSNFAQCSDENPCWCEQRWHPNCFQLCPDKRCASLCGKGGEDREIEEKDWARKDGKQWVGKGYSFDYKNEKDRPRDWSVLTTDLLLPYTYDFDNFDLQIAATTCHMNGKDTTKVSMMEIMLQTGQTDRWAAWTIWRQSYDPMASLRLYESWAQSLRKSAPTKANSVENVKKYTAKATSEIEKKAPADVPRADLTITAAIEAIHDEAEDQCQARDRTRMCKGRSGEILDVCEYSCAGPVDKQPKICGFQLCWMYLQKPDPKFISDSCVALDDSDVEKGGEKDDSKH